tara:strand:- start:146 stop:1243 length:1098 start_codon:yes stop_codon:yes gene_type:complete
MPAPQVGDLNYGGVVFYVDTTNEFVLVEAASEVIGSPFCSTGATISTATSDAILGGIQNTEIITQHTASNDAPQIISDYIQPGTLYYDWYVPSLLELKAILSSNVSQIETNRYIAYGSSSIESTGLMFKWVFYDGSTFNEGETGFAATWTRFKYIRKHNYNPSFISVENIAGNQLAQQNDLLNFGFIAYINNVSISQIIPLRSRRPFSVIICFFIDMTELADGFEATPQSLFGELPEIDSVRDYTGKVWFANSNTGTISLFNIVNGVAYQLTFHQGIDTTLKIRGDVISDIIINVPQGESWFPMVLGGDVDIILLFSRIERSKIVNIIDIENGKYFPRGGLKKLVTGKGYIINTQSEFDFKFVRR